MKKNNKTGIILIATLLFMTILIMMSVAITHNGIDSLSGGKSYSDNEQAYMAALSGVELAKAELYKNKKWGVTLNSTENTPQQNRSNEDLIVESGKDFVTGYIKLNLDTDLSTTNYDSRFDIVFSNTGNNKNRCQYVSVNNLDNKTSIPKENNANYRRDIPCESFYLVVKGTCGKRVKYIESVFTSSGPSALEQGSNALGDITIVGKTKKDKILNDPVLKLSNKNSSKNNKIIAGGNFSLTGVSTEIDDLIYTNKPSTISSKDALIGKRQKTTDREELESNNINFDNNPPNEEEIRSIDTLKKAMENANISDSSFKSKLPTGTYIFVRDTKTNAGQWQFFPQNIENQDIASFMTENSSFQKPVHNQDGISFTSEIDKVVMKRNSRGRAQMVHQTVQEPTRRITLTDNISCDGPVTFMVVDKNHDDNTYHNSQLSVDFSIDNGAIKTDGDLTIKGEVTGTGKILSNGGLTINSGSMMETKPQSGVAIWADGDVNIKEAQNLSFDTDQNTIDKILKSGYQSAFNKGITTSNGTKIQVGKSVYTVDETISDLEIDSDHGESYSFFMDEKDKKTKEIKTNEITIEIKDSKMNVYKNEKFLYTISESKIKDHQSMNKEGVNVKIDEHVTHRLHAQDYELKINNKKIGIIDTNFSWHKSDYDSSKTIYDNKESMLFSIYDHKGKSMIDKKLSETAAKKKIWLDELQNDSDDDLEDFEITGACLEDYLNAYIKNAISSTEIKGTVYSNGNIIIKGKKSSFNILGALIAQKDIRITNISSSELKYDPDYVPFFQNYGIFTNLVFQSVF